MTKCKDPCTCNGKCIHPAKLIQGLAPIKNYLAWMADRETPRVAGYAGKLSELVTDFETHIMALYREKA